LEALGAWDKLTLRPVGRCTNAKKRSGKLTDDYLDAFAGKRDRFEERLSGWRSLTPAGSHLPRGWREKHVPRFGRGGF
jgi:hypothetical protein